MRISMSLAVMMLLWLPVSATDGDLNTAMDRQVFDVLKELNNRGADLNNAGDPIGCYRTYQGGLVVLRTILSYRPPMQKVIDDALIAAERKPLAERALALHTTITELRAILRPGITPVKPSAPPPNVEAPPLILPGNQKGSTPSNDPPKPTPAPPTNPLPASFPPSAVAAPPLPITLWDRLGGESKIESAVDAWVTQSLADAKVDLTKGGTQKLEGESLSACKRRLVGYVSSLTDGTIPFVGKSITDVHAGMPTQGEAFTALLGHLRAVLNKNGTAAADVDGLVKKIEETK